HSHMAGNLVGEPEMDLLIRAVIVGTLGVVAKCSGIAQSEAGVPPSVGPADSAVEFNPRAGGLRQISLLVADGHAGETGVIECAQIDEGTERDLGSANTRGGLTSGKYGRSDVLGRQRYGRQQDDQPSK